jgi:hypothetical protein
MLYWLVQLLFLGMASVILHLVKVQILNIISWVEGIQLLELVVKEVVEALFELTVDVGVVGLLLLVLGFFHVVILIVDLVDF